MRGFWICLLITLRSSSKRMFGGLAAYLFERQMLVLVEPTKSGRWNWHGVLICTDYQHHASIRGEFPALLPHDFIRKWMFIDSSHEDSKSQWKQSPGVYQVVIRALALYLPVRNPCDRPTTSSNPGRHHRSSGPSLLCSFQPPSKSHMPPARALYNRPPSRVHQIISNQKMPEPI